MEGLKGHVKFTAHFNREPDTIHTSVHSLFICFPPIFGCNAILSTHSIFARVCVWQMEILGRIDFV